MEIQAEKRYRSRYRSVDIIAILFPRTRIITSSKCLHVKRLIAGGVWRLKEKYGNREAE